MIENSNKLEGDAAAAAAEQQAAPAASVLQTDPQKSAFRAPSKVEEFMPSAAMRRDYVCVSR